LALPMGNSLRICAGFGDKIFAQPWTTVWVTCGHSSAHIRWMGSFHHASRWKIWHPILKVFGLTWNSPYKAQSCCDELLGENGLINPTNSLDSQGGFVAVSYNRPTLVQIWTTNFKIIWGLCDPAPTGEPSIWNQLN
jgi:hypothetical protein